MMNGSDYLRFVIKAGNLAEAANDAAGIETRTYGGLFWWFRLYMNLPANAQ